MSKRLISFVLVLGLAGTTVSASELPVTESCDYDEDGMQSDQAFMNLLYLTCTQIQSE